MLINIKIPEFLVKLSNQNGLVFGPTHDYKQSYHDEDCLNTEISYICNSLLLGNMFD